eukprot:492820_1
MICLLKLQDIVKTSRHYKWRLLEMLSVMLYTDPQRSTLSMEHISTFRRAFWSNSGLRIKREFYWWGIILYRTFLYHACQILRFTSDVVNPTTLYWGIDKIFVVREKTPKYHGPVSATSVDSVAHGWTDNRGL